MRGKTPDLIGEQFGSWTVIVRAPNLPDSRHTRWLCRCVCGAERDVFSANLLNGGSLSCGCVYGDIGSQTRTHGASRTLVYKAWKVMNERCAQPRSRKYPMYGGRGITVCARWKDFGKFFADMGPRPPGMTLDRIDVNGPYSPENCRWASHDTQANNKRNTRYLTFNGETMSLSQWARKVGIPREKIRDRLDNGKWPLWRALGFTSEP